MKGKEPIVVDRLADETDMGFIVKHISGAEQWEVLKGYPVHRDDCYLFILLESGSGEMEIDFHKMQMTAPSLCAVRPGQVHYRIDGDCPDCWIVRIDNAGMPAKFAAALDDALLSRQDFPISDRQLSEMSSVLRQILGHMQGCETPMFRKRLMSALLDVFVCQAVAVACSSEEAFDRKHTRQYEIYNRFRKLISGSDCLIRTPAQCAQALCLSTSYLNEVVKRVTGSPVSYWIRDQIMLEAKRQLCFTGKSVKEVAFSIGFDDHIYFSKAFRLHTGMRPGQFRSKYRD